MIRELSLQDVAAETQTVAASHTDIGSQLGEKWRLPAEYVEVMRCHHEPQTAARNPGLTALVRFSDLLTEQWGYGVGEQPAGFTIAGDNSLRMLGEIEPRFVQQPIEQISQELFTEFEKNLEFIQMVS
jgi:HD-like signal output (HDOD) protein